MNFLGRSLAVLEKDLRAECRSRERLLPITFFIFLVMLIFSVSFEKAFTPVREIGPGVLWSSYIFASLLALNRSFADERQNDCLDGLLAAPGNRSSVYIGKMLGNLIFLLTVELISFPFFTLFFNLSPGLHMWPLLVVFALGSAGMAAVGTLFAAMVGNMRQRELLFPLLVLPLLIPPLLSCIAATAAVLAQRGVAEWVFHLRMLGVYAVVFFTLALLLFEFVIEE